MSRTRLGNRQLVFAYLECMMMLVVLKKLLGATLVWELLLWCSYGIQAEKDDCAVLHEGMEFLMNETRPRP